MRKKQKQEYVQAYNELIDQIYDGALDVAVPESVSTWVADMMKLLTLTLASSGAHQVDEQGRMEV